ncbi:MAG: hypothetical protein ACTSVZ_00105 [Promethearchaeota archaeon]
MSDFVSKKYNCPLCKKGHSIEFPKDFALNRRSYPFIHTFIHSYETKTQNSETGKDIITILYIDKNLDIRHVEAMFQNAEGNIISMEDAQKMIGFLTNQLDEVQESYDELQEKYQKLMKDHQKLLEEKEIQYN